MEPNRLQRVGFSVGSRVSSTRPVVVDSESDVDDERLPVGVEPEDVIVALECDLCSESSVVVGDVEVFVLTLCTSGIPCVQGPGSQFLIHRGWRGEHVQ